MVAVVLFLKGAILFLLAREASHGTQFAFPLPQDAAWHDATPVRSRRRSPARVVGISDLCRWRSRSRVVGNSSSLVAKCLPMEPRGRLLIQSESHSEEILPLPEQRGATRPFRRSATAVSLEALTVLKWQCGSPTLSRVHDWTCTVAIARGISSRPPALQAREPAYPPTGDCKAQCAGAGH